MQLRMFSNKPDSLCILGFIPPIINIVLSVPLWSASQINVSPDVKTFSQTVPIKLSFPENGSAVFLQWNAPDTCQIENSSNPTTSVLCPVGLHPVTAEVVRYNDENDELMNLTRILPVDMQPFCYKWQTSTKRYSDMNISVLIWITEPNRQSNAETIGVAEFPSKDSRKLTNAFQRKGQHPLIRELNREPKLPLMWENLTYTEEEGFWTADMYFHVEQSHSSLLLQGKEGLTVNGCYLSPTVIQVLLPKFSSVPDVQSEELSVLKSIEDESLVIIQDPCEKHVGILLTRCKVFMSQDGFLTTAPLTIPDTTREDYVILDVAFTSGSVLFLTTSGTILKLHGNSGQYSNFSVETGITNIRSRTFCVPSLSFQGCNDDVVAWSSSHLYLSTRASIPKFGPVKSDLLMLESLGFHSDRVQIIIYDVAFSATNPYRLLVALRAEEDGVDFKRVVFLTYDLKSSNWDHLPFWIEGSEKDVFHAEAVPCTQDCYLFWNANFVYFIKENGFKQGKFQVLDDGPGYMNKSASEAIKHIVVNTEGIFYVMMSSGRVLTGNFNEPNLVEISSLQSNLETLLFDENGFGYVVRFIEENVERIPLSHNLELTMGLNSDHTATECKYLDFEHSDVPSVYYLDINEEVHIWSAITHYTSVYNDIQLLCSDCDELRITEHVTTIVDQSRQFVNKSSTVSSHRRLSQYHRNSSGLIILEMKPRRGGAKCLPHDKMSVKISIGCPPGRHIKVRKPESCTPIQSFSIPRNALKYQGETDSQQGVTYFYNMPVYGCPIIVSNITAVFVPEVDLYDGDTFLGEVTADFYVQEMHGRDDFSYTATMDDAYCCSVAQSWGAMREMSLSDNTHDVWGTHNYKNCFTCHNFSYDAIKGKPYEVLNSSGVSAIEWQNEVNNSIYVFRLQVLDPTYSFCIFEDFFAVLVPEVRHGDEDKKHFAVQVGILGFALFTFTLAVITYMYFRKKHITEWEIYLKDLDTDMISDAATSGSSIDFMPMETIQLGRRRTTVTS